MKDTCMNILAVRDNYVYRITGFSGFVYRPDSK
jgi:hypothetical protein